MALAPCLIGYGAIARRLHDSSSAATRGEANNRYWRWIENYVAEDYVVAVRTGSGKTSLSPFSFLLSGFVDSD
jgi:thiaminase